MIRHQTAREDTRRNAESTGDTAEKVQEMMNQELKHLHLVSSHLSLAHFIVLSPLITDDRAR
jgi:hypothetical protein